MRFENGSVSKLVLEEGEEGGDIGLIFLFFARPSHCPWINNCVGHHNYKLFFLFVAYTALYGLWCLGSGIPLVVIALHDIVSEGNCEYVLWTKIRPFFSVQDADIDPHWIVFLALYV
jgi:hypothetical protein